MYLLMYFKCYQFKYIHELLLLLKLDTERVYIEVNRPTRI